jgi:nucleoside-diphosphate-sugar epimerase/sugar phosphate isomerase/epimerase
MSNGSAAIPLLKAAPEPAQVADRMAGGPWRGLELCLAPSHVATAEALERAIAVGRGVFDEGLALTAECPVAWPSGAFVRVDRLDDEARRGIEASARFAAEIGAPVLTIHLFVPLSPEAYRDHDGLDEAAVEGFLRFYADTCAARGVIPLIENVPPVLRMRTGGVYISPVGGHWRDLLAWSERVEGLRVTIDTSHAALFRTFAAAYPSLFGLAFDEDLSLERYVEALEPVSEVAHVSDAHGLLGEGLPYGAGELDLDPIVRRLGETVRYVVAEINEPDPNRSVDMKAGYRAVERAFRAAPPAPAATRRRLGVDAFDWQAVVGRRDPVPDVLELQERFGGRRVLVTGGGGWIGGRLATLLLGFRPERVTLLDSHEASLAADRRARDAAALEHVAHVLGDVRDGERLAAAVARTRPDVIFHLAAYKHVDWAESHPEEFADTNLQGSWNVLRAAEAAGVDTVVVASTDKAALAASFYGRTKRFMEQVTAYAAGSTGGHRCAVRLVNVLASAGSASELFLRQARGGVPLTVTDPGMLRYWITGGHAALLLAHGALLAADGEVLATAHDPVQLSVGELAERIWRTAGAGDEPDIELLGIRRGETLTEVLTGPGERLGEERRPGVAPIEPPAPAAGPAWVAERLSAAMGREAARAVWLEAMSRPGLLAVPARGGYGPRH